MSYHLLTFDVYTALFDVEGSLTPLVCDVLPRPVDGGEIVRSWRRKQLEYALISNALQQERVPFTAITRRALDYVLGRAELTLPDSLRQDLVVAWDRLQPWPEAAAVLAALQGRGYRMALLSNGDQAMLEALAVRLPLAWDAILSSERARRFKPDPAVYALPLRVFGLAASQVLHVAGSATDVMGAKAAGLPCAWSNRQHDLVWDARVRADHEVDDLRGLLTIL